jgi:GTPase
VIVTKIDLTPPEITKQTINSVIQILTISYKKRELILIKEGNQNKNINAENMFHDRIIPIFLVSNVSGEGIDFLREFMGNLISRIDSYLEIFKSVDDKFEFIIDHFYKVPYCGLVVSGIVTSGKVKVGSEFLLGPSSKGKSLI